MDIIKTIGIEIRFTITPFIKKINFSTRCLLNEVYLPWNRTTIYVKNNLKRRKEYEEETQLLSPSSSCIETTSSMSLSCFVLWLVKGRAI